MEISIRRIFQENNEPIKYLSVLALSNSSDIRFIHEALQTKSYPHIRVIHWGKQNEEVLNENPNLKKLIQNRLLERVSGHRILSIFVQDEEQTKRLSDLELTESDLNVIKNELRKFPYISSIDWGEENEKLVDTHPEVKSFIDIQLKTNAKNQEILNMLIDSGDPIKNIQIELTTDHLNLICDELLKHARHVHWIVWGERNQELLNSNQTLNAIILDRLIDNILYDRDNQQVIDVSKFEIDLKFLECLNKKLELNSWVGGVFWGKKNELRLIEEKSLMSRIEKKLGENNKNYKRFPSDYVYCLLASCCRNPKDRDLSEKITKLGWEIETKFDYLTIPKTVLKDLIMNIGGPIQRETKSAAILYKNRSSRQLVLAYRGIIIEGVSGLFKDEESNIVDQNVYGVLGKEITTLSYYSYVFAKHAFELSIEMNFSLSFTGYSFGAWLAEQSVFFCYNELKSSEVKAVTFDSPGSLEIIKKLFSTNVVDLYISEEKLIRALNIKTYLLSPNFVNTSNEHLGKVYRLYEGFEDEKKAAKDISSFIEEKIIDKIPSKRLKKKLKKWYETKVATDLKSYAFFLNGLRSLFTDDLGWILSLFDEKSGQVKEIEHLRRVKNWPKMNFMPRSDKFKELEVFGFDVGNVFPLASKIVGILTTPLNLAFNFGMETFAKSYFSKGLFFFNLIVEFLNGAIEANECISYYKYSLKVISAHDEMGTTILDRDMFKLVYIGNYATETVNLRSEKLNLRYIDNDKEIYDYYYGIQERYNRYPNLEEQLKSLKKSIKLTINSAMYATSIDLASPKETDVESVKEKFWRLFKLYEAYEKAYQIYKSNEDFQVTSDNFDELQSDESFIEIDESTFKDIDELLEANALMYIYGPIGSGKTTLAKQYRLHKNTTYTSFFILSSERLNHNLQEIHLRLFGTYYLNNSTEVTTSDGILLDKIKRKINDFPANTLLFIFDEVKNLSEIEPIINANQKQKLIITTKDQSIFEGYRTDIKGIKAETFDLDRSTEYFKKRIISEQILPESVPNAPLLRMAALIPERTQADEWSQAIEEISTISNQELSACILKIGVSFCEMNPDWKVDEIKDMLINKSYYNLIDPLELNVLTHLAYLDGNFINLELIKHLFIEQLYSIDTVLNSLVKIGFLQKIQRDLYEEAESYYIMPETIQNDLKETLIENNEEKRRILTRLTFVLNASINYEIGELKKYTISMLENINKHARKLINEEWENKSKDENLLMLLIKVERINNEIFQDYEESKKLLLKIIEFEKGLQPLKYAKLANLLIKIATISQNQNNLDESLEYFEDALIMINELNSQELGEANQYQEQTCHLLNQIGTIYFKQNRYNEALKYYEMALNDMSKDDRNAKSAIYNNIGLIHEKMGEGLKSIEAFQKAIELAENSESDNDLVSYLNNLGNVYSESEKYDEAKVCYERALSINRERNKPNDIVVSYRNIGSIYLKKDQTDMALDYYSNALENVESDSLEKTRILTSIGNLYKSKELYQEALNSYEKALDITKEINDDSILADLYHKISLVYHSLNEFDKAAENWEEARKIREKLNDIDELSEIEKIKF